MDLSSDLRRCDLYLSVQAMDDMVQRLFRCLWLMLAPSKQDRAVQMPSLCIYCTLFLQLYIRHIYVDILMVNMMIIH